MTILDTIDRAIADTLSSDAMRWVPETTADQRGCDNDPAHDTTQLWSTFDPGQRVGMGGRYLRVPRIATLCTGCAAELQLLLDPDSARDDRTHRYIYPID
jgi:hypothetical protein